MMTGPDPDSPQLEGELSLPDLFIELWEDGGGTYRIEPVTDPETPEDVDVLFSFGPASVSVSFTRADARTFAADLVSVVEDTNGQPQAESVDDSLPREGGGT